MADRPSPDKAAAAADRSSPDNKAATSPESGGALGSPTTEGHGPVEADEGIQADSFSDYASDVSETTSLNSSILHYTYENGRRYHAYRAGQYLLPNDEKEQERLDITHHVFRLTLNGDICATQLHDPKVILDIGTGTGLWAIEMGDMFPAAEVIGTDLSPIQSPWVPPNVKFEIDDATLDWTFPLDHFDFIHARTLAGAIADWPGLLKQCLTHLVPGGRIEIAEGRPDFCCDDGSLGENTATYRWLSEFRRLSAPLGFDITPRLPELLREAGFEDVAQMQKVVPLGRWPKDPALKEVGRWFRIQFIEFALEAYSLAMFTRTGGWTNEEFQVLLAKVREELKTNKIHLYTHTSFTIGRRPDVAPQTT